jgi:hypothetical protein
MNGFVGRHHDKGKENKNTAQPFHTVNKAVK